MTTRHQNPRILVVTTEMTFVHCGMGPASRCISARASGLGDICAAQIHGLYDWCGLIPGIRRVIPSIHMRVPLIVLWCI